MSSAPRCSGTLPMPNRINGPSWPEKEAQGAADRKRRRRGRYIPDPEMACQRGIGKRWLTALSPPWGRRQHESSYGPHGVRHRGLTDFLPRRPPRGFSDGCQRVLRWPAKMGLAEEDELHTEKPSTHSFHAKPPTLVQLGQGRQGPRTGKKITPTLPAGLTCRPRTTWMDW